MSFPPAFLVCTLVAGPAYAPRQDLDEGRFLKVLGDADAVLKGDPRSAMAWAVRSQALTALVRLPEALDSAHRALALDPNLAEGLLAQGMARAGLAVQQKNLGSLRGISDAMDDLRAAVAADPTLGRAWMTLGLGYQQLPGLLGGSTRKALECAESLRRLAPAKGALLKGTILSMDGRWAEAEPCFAAALAAAHDDPEVIYGFLDALGSRETRQALGEPEQKRRLAAEARRLLPSVHRRARGLQAVCDALLDAGDGEGAWKAASEALAGVDAPSLIRLQLGKISARSGVHRAEGLAALDQVLREPLEGGSGGYATAHWRRGQILRDLGRKAEARGAAESALRLDPKDGKAATLLKELR